VSIHQTDPGKLHPPSHPTDSLPNQRSQLQLDWHFPPDHKGLPVVGSFIWANSSAVNGPALSGSLAPIAFGLSLPASGSTPTISSCSSSAPMSPPDSSLYILYMYINQIHSINVNIQLLAKNSAPLQINS
jgi:hypothetical protein